jgi:hypothetical protein
MCEKKKTVLVEHEVKESFEDCVNGDYVEYNGKVWIFRGWGWGTYPNIEDLETGEITEIYPYY